MLCVAAICSVALSVVATENTSAKLIQGESFDCVDAFDLVTAITTAHCVTYSQRGGSKEKLSKAAQRLIDIGTTNSIETSKLSIKFCPLVSGTGLVPAPTQIYIDRGFEVGTDEAIAEVLAHELVHVRQFTKLGEREFKCDYVRAMAACGGCQDRRHPLEKEAYELQDKVRERFLSAYGIKLPKQ